MYYVDRYMMELVKEKDSFAAPERYYEYRKGTDGIIIETYIASYSPFKLIDFAYKVGEDRKLISMERKNLFEKNNVSENAVLYAYTVPPEWYDEEVAKVEQIK